MKTISIIRNRGQLTIPDSVRNMITWAKPSSAVSITILKPDEIIIRPHLQNINRAEIWENIRKSRAIVGKGKISALDFLQNDRSSH